MITADDKKVTLLALLDLSEAFDCGDHVILLFRLESKFGMGGVVLAVARIRYVLSDRTKRVCCSRCLTKFYGCCTVYHHDLASVIGPCISRCMQPRCLTSRRFNWLVTRMLMIRRCTTLALLWVRLGKQQPAWRMYRAPPSVDGDNRLKLNAE